MKNLLICSLLLLAGLLLNCGGKDDDATPDNAAACQARTEKVLAAGQAFGANPTVANCEAYRNAAQDFLNEVGNCSGVSNADIQALRNSLDDLDCSQ